MARYCFEEAEAALEEYAFTAYEKESIEHYKGLLRDTELICAKDAFACVLRVKQIGNLYFLPDILPPINTPMTFWGRDP